MAYATAHCCFLACRVAAGSSSSILYYMAATSSTRVSSSQQQPAPLLLLLLYSHTIDPTQFLKLRFQIAFLYVVRFPCFDACHRLHHGESQASMGEISLSYSSLAVIGAFLDLPLGPGFASFPDLIDKDTVLEKSILQLLLL